jgi:hypothetical protein
MAQDDASGFFIKDSYQRSHYNPAFADDKKVSIALGSLSVNAYTSGDNPLSFGVVNSVGDLVISADNIQRQPIDIAGFSSIGTVELGLRLGNNWSVSAGHMLHVAANTTLAEDFINVALDGNAPYIGQTLELNPSLHFMTYQEVYAGVGYHTEAFSGGLRLGLVSGTQSVETVNEQLNLTTSEEYYQLQFDNDFLVNTVAGVTYDGIDDIDVESVSASFGDNTGLSIDLGASYRPNSRLELSASILDLGSITWSERAQQFRSKGSFSYDGIDISEYINSDLEINFSDSLDNLLEIEETNNSYTTALPARFTLGATYDINDKWTVSGLLVQRLNPDISGTLVAINSTYSIFKFFDLGVTYSYRESSPVNFGVNVACNFGPVQLLFATDNILGFDVQNSSHVHGRLGLGLRFGKLADNVPAEE